MQKTREGCGCFWDLLGVPEENSGKVPGKLLGKCSESQNATNSRISGNGKGKPVGNLGSSLPGPCPHLPCGVFLEIDSSSLLEFFLSPLARTKRPGAPKCRIVSRNAAVHSRRKAQEGKEWLCPHFGHEDLSGPKGIKHRFCRTNSAVKYATARSHLTV